MSTQTTEVPIIGYRARLIVMRWALRERRRIAKIGQAEKLPTRREIIACAVHAKKLTRTVAHA